MAKKEENFVVLDAWCENQDKTKVSIGKASAVIRVRSPSPLVRRTSGGGG